MTYILELFGIFGLISIGAVIGLFTAAWLGMSKMQDELEDYCCNDDCKQGRDCPRRKE